MTKKNVADQLRSLASRASCRGPGPSTATSYGRSSAALPRARSRRACGCRPSASWPGRSTSAGQLSCPPIASSRRGAWCAGMSDAALSCRRRPMRPAPRSPGAGRWPRPRCARAIRPFAIWSAIRSTRSSFLCPRASLPSTASCRRVPALVRQGPSARRIGDLGARRDRGAAGPARGDCPRFGCQPDTVLVLAGAQQGLDLLARCLIDPGDTVVVDRPGYVGAIQTFRAAGARLVAGTSCGTTSTSSKIISCATAPS